MSVTGNFFSKLRSLAVTLEKEASQIDQAFNQEDSDYDDESPMRVLHDLRAEIMELKSGIQGTIDKNIRKGEELSSFLKVCRLLQKRNALDIQHVKDTFQQYGYKSPDAATSENEVPSENPKPEDAEECPEKTNPTNLPASSAQDKQAAWDLRAPQLSDFGLSHYQLPTVWEPSKEKQPAENVPEEKPKPLYRDIRTIGVAKTPKCSLTEEDDFSQIQHFGISDYSTNLNDDYTMALINKKKGSDKQTSQSLKSLLATPAQLKHRNDFSNLNSPLPPIFCTPGLKVHGKGTALQIEDDDTELVIHGKRRNERDVSAAETVSSNLVSSLHTLGKDTDVFSPHPPAFCTPGLKVQKKDISSMAERPGEDREADKAVSLDVPQAPSFETKWLKSDPLARSLDITEPIPRPDLTHTVYLEQFAPLGLNTFGNTAKKTSPPKLREFPISTPPRPEITMRLSEDMFKCNARPASPPKMSEYENMLRTPTRPEMTACISDNISQVPSITLLSHYGDSKFRLPWEDPQSMYPVKRNAENKENSQKNRHL
ncbi:spindle and kinetochore-associated protein 3 [Gastrophryne carolinensis]